MEALEKRVPTAQTSSGFFSNIPHHWQAPMEALLLMLKLMHDTVQGIERKFHTLPARARSIHFLILPKPQEVRSTHRIINPRGFMHFSYSLISPLHPSPKFKFYPTCGSESGYFRFQKRKEKKKSCLRSSFIPTGPLEWLVLPWEIVSNDGEVLIKKQKKCVSLVFGVEWKVIRNTSVCVRACVNTQQV